MRLRAAGTSKSTLKGILLLVEASALWGPRKVLNTLLLEVHSLSYWISAIKGVGGVSKLKKYTEASKKSPKAWYDKKVLSSMAKEKHVRMKSDSNLNKTHFEGIKSWLSSTKFNWSLKSKRKTLLADDANTRQRRSLSKRHNSLKKRPSSPDNLSKTCKPSLRRNTDLSRPLALKNLRKMLAELKTEANKVLKNNKSMQQLGTSDKKMSE